MRHAWILKSLVGCMLIFAAPTQAAVTAIDPNAHYPEGPLWYQGKLFYVEYSQSNIKVWDGQQARIWWHRDKCGANSLITFGSHLLVACYDENALVELDSSGKTQRVIRADAAGKPFTGPNDFCTDRHGGLYFSASGVYDIKAPISGAVLHMSPDGHIKEVANTIHYSNGLTLSRDGKHLLVAEMLAGRVLSFDVAPDDTLGTRTVWARLADIAAPTANADAYNGPDGIKLGPDGNYYIAQNGSGRVLVADENHHLVRSITVPTPFVTNVAFDSEGAVFVTGAFEQWKAPFAGAVYRWTP